MVRYLGRRETMDPRGGVRAKGLPRHTEMATATTTPETLTPDALRALLDEYADLRTQRHRIEARMSEISVLVAPAGRMSRELCHCRRCGYEWLALYRDKLPHNCARCHSARWQDDPLRDTARRPEDPANPRWRVRKGVRGDAPEKQRRTAPTAPTTPTIPAPAEHPLSPPPLPPSRMPSQAVRFAEGERLPDVEVAVDTLMEAPDGYNSK